MIVLALDTALEACSVAVVADGRPLAVRSEAMARGHQERLAPLAAEAMAEAALPFSALDRLAVTVGPGSFTGLRVGLAFAKAMSLALDIPCIGIGTLEALVESWPETAGARLAFAALDARRGHVYLQGFSAGVALMAPDNLAMEDALDRLRSLGAGEATPMAGSGAALLGREAPPDDACRVDPAVLARLAATRPLPDRRPQPLYLRAPDARTIAERLAGAG